MSGSSAFVKTKVRILVTHFIVSDSVGVGPLSTSYHFCRGIHCCLMFGYDYQQ